MCQSSKWISLSSTSVGLMLATLALPVLAGGFTFTINGETFSYVDSERSFGGRILIPDGDGPFPVIVFNHGQGGTPQGYPNLDLMRDWGAVVIAPTLAHVAGGTTAPETTGHCPENLARGLATIVAIREQAFVDPARIGVFGHSKGAYASIGLVAALGTEVRVAGMTAGGIVPDAAGVNQAAPTVGEASGAVAPFIMFHGNIDGAVPPQRSQDFLVELQARSVPAVRIVYPVDSLDPNVQHNLHQDPAINADLLQRTHDWFVRWGLLVEASLFASGFEAQP